MIPKALMSIFTFLFTLLTIIMSNLVVGFVLTQLWGWFLVPMGAMNLNLLQSIGLLLVGRLFALDLSISREQKLLRSASSHAVGAIIIWGLGYIVTLLM